ncbi:hypothetical protein QBZ16_002969 [Prototheca wickerhamii]|uniref:U3 small nucleolar RNA-associated protein 11 n=1 Tax=Prototheca wickerhamii TaxID=3111 RepID=A0AAD9MM88_PROWI|nr:hypothetical protein QBZ16_002969 [Prototheca wickerhamii]
MGLKDAVARRTYRERAQPAARRKFGLLEKKKDYVQRAKDYHKKEKAIQVLQQKAELRNPDEFYFAMEKSRTRQGVHVVPTAEANKYSQEELRLMRTQDIGYLGVKARTEAKKVEKLQKSLHLVGAATPRHTVFVESQQEQESFDPAAYFDTDPSLLDRTFNRPRTEQLAQPAPLQPGQTPQGVAARTELRVAKAYKELLQRQQRERTLSKLASKMAVTKEVMGKGRKRKLSPEEAGGKKDVFRWKAERKK